MRKIPGFLFTAPMAAIIAVFLCCINPARAETVTLLALGDSLTAGLGLPADKAFPARLEARLKDMGHDVRVVNSGVSGETSSGALARLDWTLLQEPDAVILETGANDMLRALDPDITRKNIGAILKTLKERRIPVLLAGMQSFPNFGYGYKKKYDALFPALAGEYGVLFYPFFLEGVALRPDLMQNDGLHPNAAGVERIVDGILPKVEELLAATSS